MVAEMLKLESLAHALGMAVLVEVHDRQELELALQLNSPLIGINNRNLHTFETRLDTTLQLLSHIPPPCIVITESGIRTPADVALMREHQVDTFLGWRSLHARRRPRERNSRDCLDRTKRFADRGNCLLRSLLKPLQFGHRLKSFVAKKQQINL